MPHFDDPSQLPARYREQIAMQDEARLQRHRAADESEPSTMSAEVDGKVAEFVVELPLRAWGVNEERADHWSVARSHTREAREIARMMLHGEGLPAFLERVEIEAQTTGNRLDPGSDYPLVKAVVDALVDLRVLVNDNSKWVSRIILNAPIASGAPSIVLKIRPAA
jgi:hypothetical protein